MLALELRPGPQDASHPNTNARNHRRTAFFMSTGDQLTLVFFFSEIKNTVLRTHLYRGYPTVDGSEIRLTS